MRLVLIVVLLAASADAAPLRLCRADETTSCQPPALLNYPSAPMPFGATMRFDGEAREKGSIVWRWVKAAEPTPACTFAQTAEKNAYGFACRARIGDLVMTTARFRTDL